MVTSSKVSVNFQHILTNCLTEDCHGKRKLRSVTCGVRKCRRHLHHHHHHHHRNLLLVALSLLIIVISLSYHITFKNQLKCLICVFSLRAFVSLSPSPTVIRKACRLGVFSCDIYRFESHSFPFHHHSLHCH